MLTTHAVGERLLRRKEYIVLFREKYGVCPDTVDRWVRARIIPSYKIGRITCVDPVEADTALRQRFRRSSQDTTRSLRALSRAPKNNTTKTNK
jgi:hypothetical protein